MQAKEGVLDRLNAALTIELTMINQYFLHAEMCRNWGYERLYEKFRDMSMDEMKDVQRLMRQVLYLEGLPNLQRLGTLHIGESVQQDLQLDLQDEMVAVDGLREAIAHCAQVGDFTTRALFEEMIQGEESQVDWLETQLSAIKDLGIERYLGHSLHD